MIGKNARQLSVQILEKIARSHMPPSISFSTPKLDVLEKLSPEEWKEFQTNRLFRRAVPALVGIGALNGAIVGGILGAGRGGRGAALGAGLGAIGGGSFLGGMGSLGGTRELNRTSPEEWRTGLKYLVERLRREAREKSAS